MARHIIPVIIGPTASGKSALALELAVKNNGVVINADSMQIYDGMPLLTAAPSEADKQAAAHKLYAMLEPSHRCSAASWRSLASAEIEQALNSGQTPILTGGTGFYIKALLEGLSPIPDVPMEVRVLSEDLFDGMGGTEFHAMLAEKDPVMAARLHPNDRQRLIRAWEVLIHTGKSLAEWQDIKPIAANPDWFFDISVIMPERDVLYERCNRRFDAMVEAGVLNEVEEFDALIMEGSVPFDCPLTGALGFKPLQAYLNGEMNLEIAVTMAKTETRHYAKRQMTWMRNQVKEAENCRVKHITPPI